jgi:hypothetical protein
MMKNIRAAIRLVGLCTALSASVCWNGVANAQTVAAPQAGSALATPDNAVILTVFLSHDLSRPLSELNTQLAKQGFYKAFPPPGMGVWTGTS